MGSTEMVYLRFTSTLQLTLQTSLIVFFTAASVVVLSVPQTFLFPCTTTFGLCKVDACLEASGVYDGGLTAIFAAVALFFPLRWRLRDAAVNQVFRVTRATASLSGCWDLHRLGRAQLAIRLFQL